MNLMDYGMIMVLRNDVKEFAMTITKLMDEEEIEYCMIVNIESKQKKTQGNKDNIIPNGLIKMIDDVEYINNLIDSLDNLILPRHWAQGRGKLLVCRPNKTIMALLFYYSNESAKNRKEKGIRINNKLKEVDYNLLFG